MKTKRLITNQNINHQKITEAAQLIQSGEVVAFPTETVYGLGADATNQAAIEKIFIAKGRPNDNPLIVHVATKAHLFDLVSHYPRYVEALIDAFSPGPITYVLRSNRKVASNVTAGLATVGVRIPNNKVALALLEACNLPVAAPSANTSSKPSPTTADHVLEDLNGKIAAVLDGGGAEVGVESTVVDCTSDVPLILRLGKVTEKDIKRVVGDVKLFSGLETDVVQPKSPGLKYKHYAPEVPLLLIQKKEDIQSIINEEQQKGNRVGALVGEQTAKTIRADKVISLGAGEREIASNLYDALRSVKKEKIDIIVCESFPTDEVGGAVMDRLQRAASKIM